MNSSNRTSVGHETNTRISLTMLRSGVRAPVAHFFFAFSRWLLIPDKQNVILLPTSAVFVNTQVACLQPTAIVYTHDT